MDETIRPGVLDDYAATIAAEVDDYVEDWYQAMRREWLPEPGSASAPGPAPGPDPVHYAAGSDDPMEIIRRMPPEQARAAAIGILSMLRWRPDLRRLYAVADLAFLEAAAGEQPLRFQAAVTLAEAVDAAAALTDREPSEEQRRAGNYRKGKVRLYGLDISIENARGSTRSGSGEGGKPWSVLMRHHYGYIKRTTSDADGDHVDVFLGPHPESRTVYVVDQVKPDGSFDEHKVMLGFDSVEEAAHGYLANYDAGWKGLGAIAAMPMDAFRAWVMHGDTGQPLRLVVADDESADPRRYAFDETKHPRGQPGNAGEFGPGGGGGGGGDGSGSGTSKGGDAGPSAAAAPGAAPGASGDSPGDVPAKGFGTRADPYRCGADIELAAKLLAQGHHVRLKQPDQVATLLDKMAEMIDAAMAHGDQAPAFDLCKVTAKHTNLFCQHSLGIPRIKMPQLRGIPLPGTMAATKKAGKKSGKVDLSAEFIAHLKAHGIATEETAIRASHLRASQNQIVGGRVVQLINETRAGTRDLREKPIFVTRDNYIVDGHHHWAAIVGYGYGQDKDLKVPVHKLDMDIGQALEMANDYTKEAGLAPKSGTAEPAAPPKPAEGAGHDEDEAGEPAAAPQIDPSTPAEGDPPATRTIKTLYASALDDDFSHADAEAKILEIVKTTKLADLKTVAEAAGVNATDGAKTKGAMAEGLLRHVFERRAFHARSKINAEESLSLGATSGGAANA